jgi:peptide/nickel transport system permease protein
VASSNLADDRPVAIARSELVITLKSLPWLSIIIMTTFLLAAIFAGVLSPFNPYDMQLQDRMLPPAWHFGDGRHFLGTDTLGRDMLSRMLYGARISLIIAAAGLIFGGGIGVAVGIVSGYIGGKVDALLMRLTDCFMALPGLLIALVLVVTIGAGLQTVVLALAMISWAHFSRIIRSEVMSLKERDFVLQAKVAGCSAVRIMIVHILPNVLNTAVVLATLNISQNILTEATLSFLGAGIPAPTPTWGNMVADGRKFIDSAWWICVLPGLALTLVALSFNMFGDWLRDSLDPKLRQL